MKKFYISFLLLITCSFWAQSQTYEYLFNNNLNEKGGGPPLVDTLTCGAAAQAGFSTQAVCTGGTKTVLNFNAGEGLVFENSGGFLGPNSSYTINMLFKYNTLQGTLGYPYVTGAQRLINFDTASNFGVYSFPPILAPPDGGVQFYTGDPLTSNTSNRITANTFFLFTIIRNAATDSVFIYINGHKADSIYETSGLYAPQNATAPIWFFVDNGISENYSCETGPGSISYLSISNVASTPEEIQNFYSTLCPSVLPLQLLDFKAVKQSGSVSLSWSSTNEINTSHFELERSADGVNFNKIAQISTHNTPGINHYGYEDMIPLANNFYRLKMVDLDGSASYSSVINITFEGIGSFNFFPNPANNELTITGIQRNEYIKLFNSEGKLLLEKRAAGHVMTLDISKFSKGIYILQYYDGINFKNRKLIKQ